MKLLHIDSSILGTYSASRQLTAEVVAQWLKGHPETTVEYLDLAANPVGHFGADAIAIKGVAQPEPTDVSGGPKPKKSGGGKWRR
jgi:FMN-dependent NADH-azoreductase